ncbi:unnamed protein product [Protopolystoma xenopodis]|uniref:Guanine nucleotide-binding protein G(s) subunit alpha n=1 Tax=Protopolystoma xenopodis TaxID=117903 RepID=A0A448X7W2_9PLAT|nr:unnamed protein product [Protopolystoma xenopodis]
MPFCGIGARSEEAQASWTIERRLRKDRQAFSLTHRIPVVGAGESGKSTLIKQMQLLYANGFSLEDKLAKVADIRRNIRDSLLAITAAMGRLQPPVELELAENQSSMDYIKQVSLQPDFDYPAEFFSCAQKLWRDQGLQEVVRRSNEYQLLDSARYFLDKCVQVADPNYIPSDQDILRCRVLTSGIFETSFIMNKIRFHIFDVGGQKEERRKWIQVTDF